MHGYQVTFFTQQNRRHKHTPLADWLMLTARDLGVEARRYFRQRRLGQHGRVHSAHFVWPTSHRRS